MNLNYSTRKQTPFAFANPKVPTVALGKNTFEIHALEELEYDCACQINVISRHQNFELIWITAGKGTMTIDKYKMDITDNVVYFLAPGQVRLLESDDTLQGYYITIPSEFIAQTEAQFASLIDLHNQCNHLTITPNEDATKEMLSIALRMRNEFQNYYLLRSEIMKGLLRIFMIYLSRKMECILPAQEHKSRENIIVSSFFENVKKNFLNKRTVEEYGSDLCLTPNHLNCVIKKATGFPVSHHIQQQVIMEAKKKATYSGMRLKEIANYLGFNDYAHFSKFFKNYSGTSFSSFKKTILR